MTYHYIKRELVFFNKSDLLKKDEINKKISEFKNKLKKNTISYRYLKKVIYRL